MNDLFIKASRLKLRFATTKGSIATEDLWDLPLDSATGRINLNQLAINEFNAIDKQPTVSFVNPTVKKEGKHELRLEILKHVISVKQEENQAKLVTTAKAQEKAKLLEILSKKEDAELEGLTKEQVQAKIAAL